MQFWQKQVKFFMQYTFFPYRIWHSSSACIQGLRESKWDQPSKTCRFIFHFVERSPRDTRFISNRRTKTGCNYKVEKHRRLSCKW